VNAVRFRAVLVLPCTAALLAGCSASRQSFVADPAGSQSSAVQAFGAARQSQTFAYTGNKQTFKVPKGVKQLVVSATGASGGKGGGKGGSVKATIAVTPGELLYVYVGGKGGRSPGYNGGGPGGGFTGHGHGWGGGGASDLRAGGDTLSNRIIVAGGGGGGAGVVNGCNCAGSGGIGGGIIAGAGTNGNEGSGSGGQGGQGGSQDYGGEFGGGALGYSCDGDFGLWGASGVGGTGGSGNCGGTSGGGGGGGYYGGGGGGGGVYAGSNQDAGGGGGGGSSFIESGATNIKNVAGKNSGNGQIVISW